MMKKQKSPLVYDGIKLHKPRKNPVSKSLDWGDEMLPSDESIEQDRPVGEDKVKWTFSASGILIGILLLVFGGRLAYMQGVNADRYTQLANGNRLRETISYAPRGRILDRNGKVLAENVLTFQLSAIPYLLDEDEAARNTDIEQIAGVVGLDPNEVKASIEEKGFEHPLPVLIKASIDHPVAIEVEQILPRVKGFSLDEVPSRKYVSDAGLAHVLGYVGRVNENDLERDLSGDLLPTDFIGRTGVEEYYDAALRGKNGRERTEVDALGRPVRLLAQTQPNPGNDVYLTIDYDLQVRLEQQIREQMAESGTDKGSGVFINPKNGEVLAMVSVPYYDNNLFTGGISQAEFSNLINDPTQPLLNRTISEGYTSGSTIKPLVASAALQEGVVTPDTVIVDRGYIDVTSQYQPGASFRFYGWRHEGLGPMNIRSAIAWSSNIYFYTVGGGYGDQPGLGVDRLASAYRTFGLGSKTGIDLPSEFAGRVPDPEWKRQYMNDDWYVGDTYNISIGQGSLLISPLQIAVAHASIANNGYRYAPRVVMRIGDQQTQAVVNSELPYDKNILQVVREGMRQVLTDGTTCECTFGSVPVHVAGKSGTAETNPDAKIKPNAWFSAYAAYEDPEILGTVIIENVEGGGSQFAAPPIASVMQLYYEKRSN